MCSSAGRLAPPCQNSPQIVQGNDRRLLQGRSFRAAGPAEKCGDARPRTGQNAPVKHAHVLCGLAANAALPSELVDRLIAVAVADVDFTDALADRAGPQPRAGARVVRTRPGDRRTAGPGGSADRRRRRSRGPAGHRSRAARRGARRPGVGPPPRGGPGVLAPAAAGRMRGSPARCGRDARRGPGCPWSSRNSPCGRPRRSPRGSRSIRTPRSAEGWPGTRRHRRPYWRR